jgi:hypothetical protein
MKMDICGLQDPCIEYTLECDHSARSGPPHVIAAPHKVLKIYREGRILPTKSGNFGPLGGSLYAESVGMAVDWRN